MTPSGVWTYEREFSNILRTRTTILDGLRTRPHFWTIPRTQHTPQLWIVPNTNEVNEYEAEVDNNQATAQESHQVATFQRRKS